MTRPRLDAETIAMMMTAIDPRLACVKVSVKRSRTKLFRAQRTRGGSTKLYIYADQRRSDFPDILDRAFKAARTVRLNLTNADALEA